MTLARAALALSALFLVFMIGLATASAPPAIVQPTRTLKVAELRLDAPGPPAAVAVADMRAAAPPIAPTPERASAPAQIAPPPTPPAPSPPPEILLRQGLAAVVDEGGRLGLMLSSSPGRRLHEGDSFMGWRLASVTRSGAVLARGRERREAVFFGAPVAAGGPARLPNPGLPPTPPTSAASSQPTAAEYFRGFKG